jgi:hypothetical protein
VSRESTLFFNNNDKNNNPIKPLKGEKEKILLISPPDIFDEDETNRDDLEKIFKEKGND